jgi:hypothetical protein
MSNFVKEAIAQYWGEPCDGYDAGCHTCRAWAEYDTLVAVEEEIREHYMPKIKNIFTRLHGGTDDMRDEGHKLWLIYNDLESLTKDRSKL